MQLHTLIPFLIRNNMCAGAALAAIYLGFAAKAAPAPDKLL